MSTTAPERLLMDEASSPPPRGDDRIRNFGPDDAISGAETQSPVHGSRGAISVEVDDDGTFIVQDVLGAVYGTGQSYEEALDDFIASLEEHLEFLRTNRERLHDRLLRQLGLLERLFPGR
jgi:predicted RNase H-like HicB family nuclease